jgi:hypothetical protein
MGNPGLKCGPDLEVAVHNVAEPVTQPKTGVGHNEILYTNSAMNKSFFMLIELIILNHLTLGNESVNQKVYLKFGRGMAKISEKSLSVPKDFVILKFGHEHFIHFYFLDGSFIGSFI